MIKAVLFDYFGVVSSDHYWDTVGADKEDYEDAYFDLSNQVNLGTLKWREFMKMVADRSKIPLEDIAHMYQSQSVNPEVLAVVKELHGRYKTGLLTNANAEYLNPLLDKTHMRELFDAVVTSSEVKLIKPDPKIYELILGHLGVRAEEAVMVDDVARNVGAAQELGMKGILYVDPAQMKQELAALLSG